ncbi:DUF3088 domain-containing protein [Sphingomonas sp. 2R-10]|uniref:DUF3088 domain-containing protein n=1 Tax=Sphingomonas sp. 2R-10 TaxID=3045148 RepID=UPI0019D083C4|nr:DUF3088 domain-containing protein [Sphingomonas sp. 2R-10]MDJ0277220.1 DUF3088 domain-containing protein [Sphingomonas sp. 2R-10]
MTAISGLPPIRPPGPQGPAIVPGKAPPTTTPASTPTTPPGIDTVAYDAIVAMVTRAIASLPPGMALSSFIATVARVTAEVEAQLAARPATSVSDGAPDGTTAGTPAPTATLSEAIARRLAATLAADPVAARAAIADPLQPPPATPAEVSARDLALAAAAMLGGRVDPDRPTPTSTPLATDPDRDPASTEQPMRDRLYLLDPQFDDPAHPGRSFYCRDCITLDGLLARFPDKATMLDVIRIPYPRPRDAVVAVAGEAHQNLPLLVLAPNADPALADGRHDGTHFVSDLKRLLHALHIRHGFPEAHP